MSGSAKVLVTGGAGFIGSHLVVALAEQGFEPVVLDDFSNSRPEVCDRLARITGREIAVARADVTDPAALQRVFAAHRFLAVAHLAGRKSVGQSVRDPLAYYRTNVGGSLTLCEVMAEFEVRHLLFSSSATVYGGVGEMPLREDAPLRATNPYGRSKLMVERALADLVVARRGTPQPWRVAALRYFNPVGAHPSGLIGEDPRGEPENLVPYVAQVAVGRRPLLRIFGNGYPTPDGTGVRDYIHVMDLAAGHIAALRYLLREDAGGYFVWNLGTGRGASVLEVVAAFERASGRKVPYAMVDRRPGDVASCWADPGRAQRELGWRAERSLEQMMIDVWRWQAAHPGGIASDD
ncbi:MAG: UDP-glucose 4-epimerase GalE [Pseudomonadota bacterium]